MNRSWPGVVVLVTASTGSAMRLAAFSRVLGRGTPPMTPSIIGTCPQNARVGSKVRITVQTPRFIDDMCMSRGLGSLKLGVSELRKFS